jgi:CheY-like chemotaxis protein
VARITVVDDSVEFLELMREVLRDGGHEVTALQGAEARVEDLAATAPELLIVDLAIDPDGYGDVENAMDGWALITMARVHPRLASIPIILVTADIAFLRKRGEEITRVAAVHALEKPFSLDEIDELISYALDGGAPAWAASVAPA